MDKTERERLATIETHVLYIRKEIEGYGKKGLSARVASLENWRYYMVGGITVIGIVAKFLFF